MATKTRRIKQAREYAAFKSVAAYVILRPDGTAVAKINCHFGRSGNGYGINTVTVYNYGDENPSANLDPQTQTSQHTVNDALNGIQIDGHTLAGDCDVSLPGPKWGKKIYPRDFVAPAGYSVCNWSTEDNGYLDCYQVAGLAYLRELGYRVLQAC